MTENLAKKIRMALLFGIITTFFAVWAFYRGWMVVGIIESIAAVVMWIGVINGRRNRVRRS